MPQTNGREPCTPYPNELDSLRRGEDLTDEVLRLAMEMNLRDKPGFQQIHAGVLLHGRVAIFWENNDQCPANGYLIPMNVPLQSVPEG